MKMSLLRSSNGMSSRMSPNYKQLRRYRQYRQVMKKSHQSSNSFSRPDTKRNCVITFRSRTGAKMAIIASLPMDRLNWVRHLPKLNFVSFSKTGSVTTVKIVPSPMALRSWPVISLNQTRRRKKKGKKSLQLKPIFMNRSMSSGPRISAFWRAKSGVRFWWINSQ